MKNIQFYYFCVDLPYKCSHSFPPKNIATALLCQDAIGLLHIYNKEPKNRSQVEDAFFNWN